MKFKLFGRLMKKKSIPGPQVQTERRDPHIIIDELTAKGLPESEIIRALKEEGYSFKEIDDALNESVRNEVTGASPSMYGGYEGYDSQQFQTPQDMDSIQDPSGEDQYLDQDIRNMDSRELNPAQRPAQFTDSTNMAPVGKGPAPSAGITMPEEDNGREQATLDDREREDIYEIVESVVNERVNSLKSDIKEIDAQIKSIQEIISEFKSDVQEQQDARRKEFGSTHESIKDNTTKIIEMEPRVAGLEKAFKDIVPNLVDSVREVKEFVSGRATVTGLEQRGSAQRSVFDDAEFGDSHSSASTKDENEHESGNIFDDPETDECRNTEKHKRENTPKEKGYPKGASAKEKEDKEPVFDESDDDERI